MSSPPRVAVALSALPSGDPNPHLAHNHVRYGLDSVSRSVTPEDSRTRLIDEPWDSGVTASGRTSGSATRPHYQAVESFGQSSGEALDAPRGSNVGVSRVEMVELRSRDLIPLAPKRAAYVLLYYAAFVLLGLVIASPGPILLSLAKQVDCSLNAVSFLFAVRALGYTIGSVAAGTVMEGCAKSGHPFLSLMLVLSAVTAAAVPFTESFYVLAAVLFAQGVTLGPVDTAGNVFLLALFRNSPEDGENGPYMQGLHCAFAVGAFLSPLVIELAIVIQGSYRLAFYAFGLFLLPVGMATCLLDTPDISASQEVALDGEPISEHVELVPDAQMNSRRHSRRGSGDGERAYVTDNTATGKADPSSRHAESPSEPRPALTRPLRLSTRTFVWLTIVGCSILLGVYVGLEVSYGGLVATFAVKNHDTSARMGRYITSVYWGCLAIGRFLAVFTSAWLTPRALLYGNLAGCVAAAAVLWLFTNFADVLWAASGAFGFFMACIFPTTFLFLEETVPVKGYYASVLVFGGTVGEFILPALTGNVMAIFGAVFFADVVLFSAALLLAIVFCVECCSARVKKAMGRVSL